VIGYRKQCEAWRHVVLAERYNTTYFSRVLFHHFSHYRFATYIGVNICYTAFTIQGINERMVQFQK
jgi:hypothetical protein